MESYLNILRNIKKNGVRKENRTGIDTLSITGHMFEHDMRDGFPLQTTKFVPLRMVARETVFFLQGINDKQYLKDHNIHIWDGWANPQKVAYGHSDEAKSSMAAENDLGEIYGVQWRQFNRDVEEDRLDKMAKVAALEDIKKTLNKCQEADQFSERDLVSYFNTLNEVQEKYLKVYEGVDQLKNVIDKLKTNPFDRRMIVTAWNPTKLDHMALPPCHYSFQVLSDGKHVDLLWSQRSCDVPLGIPFNIASYGLILELIAKQVGMIPRKLIGFLADVHYYVDQEDGVNELLSREPGKLPTLELPDDIDIFTWEPPEDIKDIIKGYEHQGKVPMPVAI